MIVCKIKKGLKSLKIDFKTFKNITKKWKIKYAIFEPRF